MPFANLSGDAGQAYFSEGVAEELRSALSRIGLEVIGRSSSDAVKDLDTKTAAAKLGVSNVLTGSVRRSPETIRIDAQLIGGSDGVERWTQSYDRAPGDAIKIQTDIATNVAQALSVALGQAARAAVTLGGTADSAAQDLYLKGLAIRRTADSEESLRQALGLSNAALARDPNYADAHVLRALVLDNSSTRYAKTPAELASTLAQAAAAADRAIAIAPGLGYAYAVLGTIEGDRLDFAGALSHVRRSLALSPDDPNVIRSAANVVPYLGSPQEALRLADRQIALDPLEPRAFAVRAQIFEILRRYPEAIDAARKALQLAPQLSVARIWLGDCLTLMNRAAEAKTEYQKLPADDVFRLTGEAILAARSRDLAGAEKIMARLRALYGPSSSYQYAQIYAQAGDAGRAFAELGNAVEAKDPGLQLLKTDPFMDPVRGDPRYGALLKQLNFP